MVDQPRRGTAQAATVVRFWVGSATVFNAFLVQRAYPRKNEIQLFKAILDLP